MTILDYLGLTRRHWLAGVLLTGLVTICTVVLVQWKNNRPFETTVFLTIGTVQQANSANSTSIDEIVQAADQFSETVQGWFKNPDFQKGIRLIGSSEINVRKQEKQNLLITFSNKSGEQAQEMNNLLQSDLQKEIEKYNAATGSKFILAIYEVDYEQKTLPLLFFLLVGLLGGLAIAPFALYGYEYLFQKVSSSSQASDIFKKQPLEKLSNIKNVKPHELDFLSAYLNKIGKDIQFIGAGSEINSEIDTLMAALKHNKVEGLKFPKESGKIKTQAHHVIVCLLGKTSTDDLQKIQVLLPSTFDLLIVEA